MADANDKPGAAVAESALADLALDDLLQHTWRLLEDGVDRGRAPFHTPVLATCGTHGPMQRTVVLRHVDPARRQLTCHTDRRSAKVAELAADPRASWLFYDRDLKLQLRMAGAARVHTDDDIADAAWARSANRSRACYRAAASPGSVVSAPPAAPQVEAGDDTTARANFVAVTCEITFLDWLYLRGAGHRRAHFHWRDGELTTASWVAP